MPTIPDASAISTKWESVLNLADMFDMDEVAQVATYALDRCGTLSDMRKIALCVRHQIPREWALEALKNVCSRKEVISVEEAKEMGVVMMALVPASWASRRARSRGLRELDPRRGVSSLRA